MCTNFVEEGAEYGNRGRHDCYRTLGESPNDKGYPVVCNIGQWTDLLGKVMD